MAIPGSGYQIADDVLAAVSAVLFEPVVRTTLLAPVLSGYGDGGYGDNGYGDSPPFVPNTYIAQIGDAASLYVGAQVVVGRGTETEEVVTILSLDQGSFTAWFEQPHQTGDSVRGSTFPVCQISNPFFTQAEMLNYLTDVENAYLQRVPIAYADVTQSVTPSQTLVATPANSMQIERVAVGGRALNEGSQTAMDLLDYRWGETAGMPRTWYEDRTGLMVYGLDRVPGNAFETEVLYSCRENTILALNEGFYLPDPFLTYLKYGVLAEAFSKDGEMRDPERARYCQGRFDTGVKIGQQFLASVTGVEAQSGG